VNTAPALELPDLTTSRAQVLLALGDDELISGHRAAHWTGVAPSLEEDLAFSTIAQDGVNHADVWYQVLLGEDHERLRAAVDAVGLGRGPDGYRHAICLERPPRDFALTLATHWAYDRFDAVRLGALADSADADVAAVARKLLHEARYHLEHADHWFQRLATGGDDAHQRFGTALGVVLPEALGLGEAVPAEDEAVHDRLLPVGHPQLRERWLEVIGPMLQAAGYGELVPSDPTAVPAEASGGRAGRHGPDFTDDVWPEMTALYRAHPGARW
jgi:ring-1,2-phenylacetyl-CoA epoxidase subunit PaaC